jgi:hypothetical protein
LILKDRRSVTSECNSARGDFNHPFAASELRDKFRDLAGLVLTPMGISAVMQAVDRSDTWEHVSELPSLLRQHGWD